MGTHQEEASVSERKDPETTGTIQTGSTETTNGVSSLSHSVGKDATFSEASVEIGRIISLQKNYYEVLKVTRDTPQAEIRGNYLRLSRLVHPDKCQQQQAPHASAVVNEAYDTLRSETKKALYDRFLDSVDLEADEGVSYAEWEAENVQRAIEFPAWLQRILRVPGGSICVLIVAFIPLLVVLLLCIILTILCVPVYCLLQLCTGKAKRSSPEPSPDPAVAPQTVEPIPHISSERSPTRPKSGDIPLANQHDPNRHSSVSNVQAPLLDDQSTASVTDSDAAPEQIALSLKKQYVPPETPKSTD